METLAAIRNPRAYNIQVFQLEIAESRVATVAETSAGECWVSELPARS